jgi:hypothetical protein
MPEPMITPDGHIYDQGPDGKWHLRASEATAGLGPAVVGAAIGGDPYRATREARAVRSDDRAADNEAERLRLAREKERRDAMEWAATHNPDGSPKPKAADAAPKSDSDLATVRNEALDKIRLARSLQGRSRNGWFTTGLGASLAGAVGGTPAYDVKQDTETLKNAGALTRIMEMARTNGGKNPLTPLSNADFQALSSSLANLDTSQSDDQYQANVQRVIDLYEQAYKGAGGSDLEGDLDPAKRRKRGEPPVIGAGGPGSPSSGRPTQSTSYYGDGGNGGGDAAALATGATKTERDPALAGVNARVASMLASGASDQAIQDYLQKSGTSANAASVAGALRFRKQNPGYKGGYKVDLETRDVPTTGWNRFSASPTGTGILAAVDGASGGLTDEFASLVGGGDPRPRLLARQLGRSGLCRRSARSVEPPAWRLVSPILS